MAEELPNENTTAYMAHEEMSKDSFQVFMEGLDSVQKRRFCELLHHAVYIGFSEGLNRRDHRVTEDMKARVFLSQVEIFMQGAGMQEDVCNDY